MRVLKWRVTIDDEPHRIGGGSVVLVAIQPTHWDYHSLEPKAVTVWTIEADDDADIGVPRQAQVYGTGMYLPSGRSDGLVEHLGSCVDGQYVWHVAVVDDDRWYLPPQPPKPLPC